MASGMADHYSAMAADALYWDWHDDAEFWGGLSAAQSDWAQWYGTAPPEMPWNEPWAEWTVDEDSQAEPWAMWSSDPLFGDSPAFDDEPIDWQRSRGSSRREAPEFPELLCFRGRLEFWRFSVRVAGSPR